MDEEKLRLVAQQHRALATEILKRNSEIAEGLLALAAEYEAVANRQPTSDAPFVRKNSPGDSP